MKKYYIRSSDSKHYISIFLGNYSFTNDRNSRHFFTNKEEAFRLIKILSEIGWEKGMLKVMSVNN